MRSTPRYENTEVAITRFDRRLSIGHTWLTDSASRSDFNKVERKPGVLFVPAMHPLGERI
jgi:hypothetical protein